MRIGRAFEVARPPEAVWEFFSDVPAVAQCLPGARITEGMPGGSYTGTISVKLGPLAAVFEGEARVALDDSAKQGTIDGKGVDRRGGSRGSVKMVYRLEPHDDGTRITVDADITLSGAIAQFGRSGLIDEMSSRLIGEFVSCVEAKLAAGSVEEAEAIVAGDLGGVGLLLKSLWVWIRRLLGATSR